jgi:hypothetical protein
MKPSKPEFSRPLPVDRVRRSGSTEKITADAKELKALATRMSLPAIHNLAANLRVTPWRGGGLKVEGTLTADIEQVSVISLEAFRQTVDLPILRYYMPEGATPLSEEDDIDPILQGSIDLGEATAEALALDLDPYPRKPGEAFAEHVEFDEDPPEKESPFNILTKPGND